VKQKSTTAVEDEHSGHLPNSDQTSYSTAKTRRILIDDVLSGSNNPSLLEQKIAPCMVSVAEDIKGLKPLSYSLGEEESFLGVLKENLLLFKDLIKETKGYDNKIKLYDLLTHDYSPLNGIFCRLMDCVDAWAKDYETLDKTEAKAAVIRLGDRYEREIFTPIVKEIKSEALKKSLWEKIKEKPYRNMHKPLSKSIYKTMDFAQRLSYSISK